ncbi:DNA translocase FtsK [Halomonas sp. GFAJ-1]|uniref:DNA translocase FtsK n=1 Tax=Halomonas sp. GFAJ-1 TaxID=1118153 RepID=UPI0005567EEA|nr:DNA translocase FtsK [Halomonas sp. GFAJ-1]AVI62780.1 cell division protein FtsK [Halomonas sp. GFAJ-1]
MKVNKAVDKRTQRNSRQPSSSSSSARVKAAKDKARRFGLRLQGSVREGVVVVLLALCVFLLLALFSYHPADPGWSYQGPETDVRNWMGPVGAWLADVLYSLLGASALWWPGMLGYAAWWLMRSRQVRFEVDPVAIAVHAGGLLLLMFGTTMLGALHFYHPNSILPYASGGILGEGLVGTLKPLVSSGGVGLIAAALILIGFPLFSGMSWLQVADEVGRRLCKLGGWFSARRAKGQEKRAERAAVRAAAKAASQKVKERSRVDEPKAAGSSSVAADTPKSSVMEPKLFAQEHHVETPSSAKKDIEKETEYVFEKEDEESVEKAHKKAALGSTVAVSSEAGSDESEPTRVRGRERREPSFSSAFASADDAPSATMDTSIPWEAAAAPKEWPAAKVEPTKVPVEPARSESTAVEPAATEPAKAPEPTPNELPRADAFAMRTNTPDEPIELRVPLSAKEPEPKSEPETEQNFVSEPKPKPEPVSEPEPEQQAPLPAVSPRPPADTTDPVMPIAAESRRERVPEVVPEPVWDEDEDVAPSAPAVTSARHEPTFSEPAEEEADNGPTLWTVEHLQSQRPVFETLDEPEGDVPSLQLLTPPEPHQPNYTDEQLSDMAELLEVRLREYGVKAEVVDTWPGPVITRFEIKPAAGVKVSKISNLAKDLARSLMVKSVRVVEVIPGRPTVGIEIPNPHRAMIRLREVIDSDRYQQETSPLTMALGQDIGGGPVVANLGKMPHLLVAGTTGSGKSVGVNAMLISMLLKATPDELKLIMVDPKMLELSVYDGIPHLLAPVVTDMKEAANSLRWCVAEMERRYKLMAAMGVRNIAGFNGRLDEAGRAGAQVADPLWEPQPWEMHQTPPVLEKLPYIVVVIDEFADMFMIVGKKVEELIARLAQKARAAGIHLILATQRPSVDVVTGLIKANIPSRMAFQVSSRIDSRTILDQGGAESLLGHGDMLYLPAGSGPPNRIHGAFVDDDEVHRVVDDWKRRGTPEYIEEILSGGVSADALTGLEADGVDGDDAEQDALYDEAVQFVTQTRKASISAVQRRFKIGYNRAARLVEAMEGAGVVSSMGTNGAREVLAPPPVGH